MDVARREKLLLTRGDPAIACRRLTLRAVAIAAAVVGNSGTMPAAGALIDMTAGCGGATPRDGQTHFAGPAAGPPALSPDKSCPPPPDKIRPLHAPPPTLP